MSDPSEEWKRRHIAAFRFHRGHDMCTVEGCIGAQPLMWVPTADEDGEVAANEAEVIVLSVLAQDALEAANRRQQESRKPYPEIFSQRDHIHWAV
ncbi:hypothetical protein [Actinoplanes rectilineatus]|uniref:hypothetical protein n=1 Tax=Actinoplanes rectilineatus TaxID=113571 RepID=UPI0005F28A12|nr:hypothetical protein [Actinoplanes rectilineatus]